MLQTSEVERMFEGLRWENLQIEKMRMVKSVLA